LLLVAPTTRTAIRLCSWLTEAGWPVCAVASFAAAKTELKSQPSLLVTEVCLSEHNGLHLALHAHARSIPTIILGIDDSVLRQEAERLNAVYLTSWDRRELLDEIERLVGIPDEVSEDYQSLVSWGEWGDSVSAFETAHPHHAGARTPKRPVISYH
jgi:hypothetical protein